MKKFTMKTKFILFGTIPVAAIAMTFLFSSPASESNVYQPREKDRDNVNSMQGAMDYYHMLRGDFTKEDYMRGYQNAMALNYDRAAMGWIDQGPDNIGGRTRAICVDRNDVNHIYAGGVSGGLWESYNRANTWHQVTEFNEVLGIASICQTVDGTFYVATGHKLETSSGFQSMGDGYNGNGVYEVVYNTTTRTNTVTQMPGTETPDWINAVVADTLNANTFWMATEDGLRKYSPSGGLENITTATSGTCPALSMSPDGQVIVAVKGVKTNVSTDGGVTWSDVTNSSVSSSPIPTSSARLEVAVTYDKASNGNHYVYAVGSIASGALRGVWRSTDNGINWTEIAPPNNGDPGSFAPFDLGIQFQGWWDQHIATVRGNPEKCILGGIDCYSWASNGNWTQISNGYIGNDLHPIYMHPDQHVMVTDQWGRMYFGNDGGVYFSDDNGLSFHPANRGYNVATCYTVGYSAHGDVITGMQDNGSTANYHDNSTFQEHDEVSGGDGVSSHLSFINRNITFSTYVFGQLYRSSDRGGNVFTMTPTSWTCTAGEDCGPFATVTALWEDPDDENSADSVMFVPGQSYTAGDAIEVPSRTTGTTIYYNTPINLTYDDTLDFNPSYTVQDTIISTITPSTDYNLSIVNYTFVYGGPSISAGDSLYLVSLDTTVVVDSYSTIDHYYGTNPSAPGKTYDMGYETQVYGIAWDTLAVQDRFQSWFAVGGPDGVYMTRNALRFSASANEWFKVTSGTGTVMTMEFSRDGNHLFIGTNSGQLWRLSGFGGVYSPAIVDDPAQGVYADTLINWDLGHYATTLTNIGSFGSPVTGIAVGSDVDHVVVALGSFSGPNKVRECTDATSGAPTFNSITGSGANAFPSGVPAYSCVIDRDDPNLILVGTEFGVFRTTNGGSAWENVSGAFGAVPVYDMKQGWRTWNEGNFKPGVIYIATHGRGLWSSEDYLAIPDAQDNLSPEKFIPNINVYPNPLSTEGTLAFDLQSNSDVYVQIYNLNGQLVEEITESNMNAGSNVIQFSADALPKGTYIIRLTAGEMVETTKFIKH